MKEPILSREQVLKIVRKTLKENNDRDKLSSDRFVALASAFEEALLEKLLGMPIAYTSEDGLRLLSSDEEICVWAPDSPIRRQRDIPLYALKDRQS